MPTYTICAEKTAITTGVCKSAVLLSQELETNTKLLDYGAGKLRNTNYLNQVCPSDILDTPKQLEGLTYEHKSYTRAIDLAQDYYDFVLCSFVLNVVLDIYERDAIILSILHTLKPGGVAYIEVRGTKGILSNKNLLPHEDGYIVGSNKVRTFQKPYTLEDLQAYLSAFPYSKLNFRKESDSVIAIITK